MPQYRVLQGQTADHLETEINKLAQRYELVSFAMAPTNTGPIFVAVMKIMQ